MIKDFQFYHGAVFAGMLHLSREKISIKSFSKKTNTSYILNETTGLYFKYCTKRLSPWVFSFSKRNHQEILELKNAFERFFLILICNDDGVVVLNFDELKQILEGSHDEVDWIRVERSKGQMYAVKGSDGKLQFKIGQNDFPNKIINYL